MTSGELRAVRQLAVEPRARRTIFASFRRAALELWGERGLSDLATRMSEEARRACIEPITIAEEMLPERYVLEWYQAAWEGPVGRDRVAYKRFLQKMMDHGFGRVRKFLLQVAPPSMIVNKCSELWSHDHSHGALTKVHVDGSGATMMLADHPYLTTPLARTSIAEIIRYAVALGRVREVCSAHQLEDPQRLRIVLTWT